MSRLFTGLSADHLDSASAYPFQPPLSISVWVRMTTLAVAQHIVNIGDGSTSNNRYSTVHSAADVATAQEKDATTQSVASAQVANADVNNFHMYTSVFISHSSRSSFLDGQSKGNVTGARTTANATAMRISGDCAGGNRLNGYVGHIAIWDIDLSDSDVANLFTMDPRLIQSNRLAHYWPLNGNQSPEPDYGFRNEPLIVNGAPAYSPIEPPQLNWIQEAGLIATIIRAVAG